MIADYDIGYGNVTSSRTVIKNKWVNLNAIEESHDADIWSRYGNIIYPYLSDGQEVYGEICGYTPKGSSIQKGYDYGCKQYESFLMPYRVTTLSEDGTKREWLPMGIVEWTKGLLAEHEELKGVVRPMEVLYHGTLGDLYPDIPADEHWGENVLSRMRADKKTFWDGEERAPLQRQGSKGRHLHKER